MNEERNVTIDDLTEIVAQLQAEVADLKAAFERHDHTNGNIVLRY